MFMDFSNFVFWVVYVSIAHSNKPRVLNVHNFVPRATFLKNSPGTALFRVKFLLDLIRQL